MSTVCVSSQCSLTSRPVSPGRSLPLRGPQSGTSFGTGEGLTYPFRPVHDNLGSLSTPYLSPRRKVFDTRLSVLVWTSPRPPLTLTRRITGLVRPLVSRSPSTVSDTLQPDGPVSRPVSPTSYPSPRSHSPSDSLPESLQVQN